MREITLLRYTFIAGALTAIGLDMHNHQDGSIFQLAIVISQGLYAFASKSHDGILTIIGILPLLGISCFIYLVLFVSKLSYYSVLFGLFYYLSIFLCIRFCSLFRKGELLMPMIVLFSLFGIFYLSQPILPFTASAIKDYMLTIELFPRFI